MAWTDFLLDTSSLIATLAREPGAEEVARLKENGSIPFVALSEVYAWSYRAHGRGKAREIYAHLLRWQRPILYPNDRVVLVAGQIKGQHPHLSLADSLIGALALEHELTLVTKDRGFKTLAPDVKLRWI